MVSKSLREIRCGKGHASRHCCGMTIKEIGLGYPDLDELLRNPQPLEFIFGREPLICIWTNCTSATIDNNK